MSLSPSFPLPFVYLSINHWSFKGSPSQKRDHNKAFGAGDILISPLAKNDALNICASDQDQELEYQELEYQELDLPSYLKKT